MFYTFFVGVTVLGAIREKSQNLKIQINQKIMRHKLMNLSCKTRKETKNLKVLAKMFQNVVIEIKEIKLMKNWVVWKVITQILTLPKSKMTISENNHLKKLLVVNNFQPDWETKIQMNKNKILKGHWKKSMI